MCRLQFRKRNNSSRARYYGVKLLTQKMRACQSSALMNGPPDVCVYAGGWISIRSVKPLIPEGMGFLCPALLSEPLAGLCLLQHPASQDLLIGFSSDVL